MFVCLCLGITDRQIEKALRAGARDVNQVGLACGAGTACGACRPEIARLLAECPFRRGPIERGCPAGILSSTA